jgi:hypothetical protein
VSPAKGAAEREAETKPAPEPEAGPQPTWYAPNQQCVGVNPAVVNATGATAGIPGSWTPAGSTPPVSPTALMQGVPVAVTASPATAWTTGQYVQTQTAGAAGRACWTGSAWVGGAAP